MYAVCNPAHELLRVVASGRNLVTHNGETISDASLLSPADLLARYVIAITFAAAPDPAISRIVGNGRVVIEWPTATLVYDAEPIPAVEVRAAKVAAIKAEAAARLAPTDWLVIRQAEGGAAAPAETLAYRAAVREASNAAEAAVIAAGDDTAAIIAVSPEWSEEPAE